MDIIKNYLDIIRNQAEIIINSINHIEDEDKSTKAYLVEKKIKENKKLFK